MAFSEKTLLWVVIVSYNSAQWIRDCLKSIRGSTLLPNVVVVDNNSQDETRSIITDSYPEVTLLRNPENKGFGQACNLGMKYALNTGAEYIVQMNDDAQLNPSTLLNLLSVTIKHPEYGIVIPLNLTVDGTVIDAHFAAELEKYHPPELLHDYVLRQTQDVYEVPMLPGAVLLVKRQVLEELGGLDPLFFVLGVEYDFCLRTTISPWKVGFVPHAVVRHQYNRPKDGQHTETIKKYTEDFYSTSLFILKRLDHSFAYMLLYESAYYFYQIFLALKKKNWKKAVAVVMTTPKLLKALPTIWTHRKRCLERNGVFLADINLSNILKKGETE